MSEFSMATKSLVPSLTVMLLAMCVALPGNVLIQIPQLMSQTQSVRTPKTASHTDQDSPPSGKQSLESMQIERKRAQKDALRRLASLVDDAGKLDDVAARVRIQARIAELLWERDEARARKLFQIAYDDSAVTMLSSVYPGVVNPSCGQTRSEIIRAITRHDPKLASGLVGTDRIGTNCDFGPRERNTYDDARSVLLVEVASAVASQDPAAAARLARESLSSGIVFSFPDLLLRLVKVDSSSSEDVLDAALFRIETQDINALEMLTLARYLLGDEMAPRPMNERARSGEGPSANIQLLKRFLNASLLATNRFVSGIARSNGGALGTGRPFSDAASAEEVAASFFTALTNLLPAFEHYDQERLSAARTTIERLKRWMDPISRDHMFVFYDNGDTPERLVAEAEASRDPRAKWELLQLAVSLADQKGDSDKALSIASKIGDAEKRAEAVDEVWTLQISNAVNSKHYAEAQRLTERVSSPERRILELIMISTQAVQSGYGAQTADILDEAKSLLLKSDRFPTPEHVEELMHLARIYARVDVNRGFDVMKATIDAINLVERMPRDADAHKRFGHPPGSTDPLSLFASDLTGFESLGRADYFRALRLARTFKDDALSIASELAVVRATLPAVR
jgi:hypothetical protein